jgi:hypothetical protein
MDGNGPSELDAPSISAEELEEWLTRYKENYYVVDSGISSYI